MDDIEHANTNIVLSNLVHKDWKDVQTFATNGKLDLMLMLNDNNKCIGINMNWIPKYFFETVIIE